MSNHSTKCVCCSKISSSTNRTRTRTQFQSRAALFPLSPLAIVFVLSQTPTSHGFSPSSSTLPQKAATRIPSQRHYRQANDVENLGETTNTAVSFLKFLSPSQESLLSFMPTWLRLPRGHMAEENIAALRGAMVSTYLTELEADTVLRSIHEAANGDRNKIAGAAEFCKIMVDAMEMDKNTLIAGAFHYCTCVMAREESALLPPQNFSSSSFWDRLESTGHQGSGIQSYGAHAAYIARDAARLKRTETLASSVSDENETMNLSSLLLSETKDWRALAIRSAACLYRLRGLLASQKDASDIKTPLTKEEVSVAREALNIYAPLASRLGMHRLKNELEGAAFRIRYRRQYQRVTSLAQERRSTTSNKTLGESLQSVLNEVANRITTLLEDDRTFCKYANKVEVSARVKEPYSLWKKMLRTDVKDITDIPDSIALRVVLSGTQVSPDENIEVTRARERALCYYVQKKCIDRFDPLGDGRFRDYVNQPKRNGYQSLHYTAHTCVEGQNWPFEIQVRSEDMHRVAEFGVAAHWDYKDQGKDGSANSSAHHLDKSLESYLRSVQEYKYRLAANASFQQAASVDVSMSAQNQSRAERVRARAEQMAPYIEALSLAKLDLTRENVFIFLKSAPGSTEGDKILALPSGACILDALRMGERRFGVSVDWRSKTNEDVIHNGVLSNVTQKLNNGDVVTVLNTKSLSV